jgi:hypothetical protein
MAAPPSHIRNPGGGMPGFPDGTTNMGGTRSSPEHDMGWIVLRSILLMAELIVITMK